MKETWLDLRLKKKTDLGTSGGAIIRHDTFGDMVTSENFLGVVIVWLDRECNLRKHKVKDLEIKSCNVSDLLSVWVWVCGIGGFYWWT